MNLADNSLLSNAFNNTRHYAYWMYLCDDRFKCSNCGAKYSNVENKTHCPECRAEIINSERSVVDA